MGSTEQGLQARARGRIVEGHTERGAERMFGVAGEAAQPLGRFQQQRPLALGCLAAETAEKQGELAAAEAPGKVAAAALLLHQRRRSAAGRAGNACVNTCRSRWSR